MGKMFWKGIHITKTPAAKINSIDLPAPKAEVPIVAVNRMESGAQTGQVRAIKIGDSKNAGGVETGGKSNVDAVKIN